MAISVKYSVKAQDLEEARAWIGETTGLEAEARESSYWGGDYYLFETSAGEELKLINNVDIYDGEPATGEQVRIMKCPKRRYKTDPPEKHYLEHYYRYRKSANHPWGAPIPIPDKPGEED